MAKPKEKPPLPEAEELFKKYLGDEFNDYYKSEGGSYDMSKWKKYDPAMYTI